MSTPDLGDVHPLSVVTRDSAGDPADVGTIALAITLPDGTAVDPAPSITNPPDVTGTYTYDYLTTMAGLHTYRWLATGENAAAYADSFNVIDSTWRAIVGLAETKTHLGITDDDADEKLRGFILSASAVVEGIVGAVARRTVTETYHGGGCALVLRSGPVLSITSVTENGTAVDSSNYSVSDAGVLYRASNYIPNGIWLAGINNVTVTYVVGRTVVPFSVLDATKELIRINWRPQQGGNYSPFDQGTDDDYGTREVGEIRLGFSSPHRHATPRTRGHPGRFA